MKAELLAPAGGMLQLKTAIRFGADAVYGGIQNYGLRAFASNFSWDELKEGLDICHSAGKNFYLTLNFFPYEEELDGLSDAAKKAFELGVDAVVVSDLGAFLRLHRDIPALPLHISTQANTMNAEACRFYAQAGATRVVLARELSLARIAELRKAVPEEFEIEAFIHGAMCVSHSGRCLLSDHLTGRGGNRGECAQPCRWEYALQEEKRPGEYFPIEQDERGTYILSAYDLNMLEHLPEMLKAGVCSLKVEGRMKTEYYVANVISAYRHALDAYYESEEKYYEVLPELVKELNKAGHRKNNTGFYFGPPTPPAGTHGTMQDMEYVARVLSQKDGIITAEVKNRFFVGDTLELLSPDGMTPFEVTSMQDKNGLPLQTVSVAGQAVSFPGPDNAAAGDFLRGPNRNLKKDAK